MFNLIFKKNITVESTTINGESTITLLENVVDIKTSTEGKPFRKPRYARRTTSSTRNIVRNVMTTHVAAILCPHHT